MNKVICNSLPKSGTHLVNKLLDNMGYEFSGLGLSTATLFGRHALAKYILRGITLGRPCVDVGLDITACVRQSWVAGSLSKLALGNYCGGHLPYSDCIHHLLDSAGVKVIHILRDPRDVLLSWAHYVPTTNWHYGREGLEGLPLEQRVIKILHGYRSGHYIVESFSRILVRSNAWIDQENVFTIRFEDLVGSKGGGSDQDQFQCINSIGQYLGVSGFDAENISKLLFGGTKVFRKGKIGSYTDELSGSLTDVINETLQKHIVRMGYQL